MSDADELREAAALIRERAEGASQGRWAHMCMGSEGCAVHNDGHLRERVRVTFCGRKEWKADHRDAEHIAGWSREPALAVADWLDAEAEDARIFPLRFPQALAVARAYLGTLSAVPDRVTATGTTEGPRQYVAPVETGEPWRGPRSG